MSGDVFSLAAEQWASADGCQQLFDHWMTSPGKHEAEGIIGELAALVPTLGEGAPTPRGRVVDLGCGPGRLIGHLPAFGRYDGFDLSPHMLQTARETYSDDARCRFVERDAFRGAPYRNPVDLLMSIDTSRHYHDPLGFLRMVVEKWPARYYLFTVLHGTPEELINGQVVATEAMEAALVEMGRVVSWVDQPLPNSTMNVRYALLESHRVSGLSEP